MKQSTTEAATQQQYIPAMRTLSVKFRCRETEVCGALRRMLCEVFDHVLATGALQAGPPYLRLLSLRDDECEFEVGYPVCDYAPWSSRIASGELPACTAIVSEVVGHCHSVRAWLEQCIAKFRQEGAELDALPLEFFHNDPRFEPDPAKWRTAVVWPLASPVEKATSRFSVY